MKVFMPKPREDWICDVIISEFERATSHTITHTPREADVIFLFARWIWRDLPMGLLTSRKVISTVHHIVPEKLNPAELRGFDTFTDLYHVPNDFTRRAIQKHVQKPIQKLPYWINPERWFMTDDVYVPPVGNSIVLASFQRDTEGSSSHENPIPKLEKGPDIFVEIVKRFNSAEVLAYVPGWRRRFVTKSLDDAGFQVMTSNEKLPEGMINSLYNVTRKLGGWYLVTSRHEGGPQAVLEASITRTPILSTDVGLASDVLHPDCICQDVDEFVEKIRKGPDPAVIEFNYQSVQRHLISQMVPQYDRMIEEVTNG